MKQVLSILFVCFVLMGCVAGCAAAPGEKTLSAVSSSGEANSAEVSSYSVPTFYSFTELEEYLSKDESFADWVRRKKIEEPYYYTAGESPFGARLKFIDVGPGSIGATYALEASTGEESTASAEKDHEQLYREYASTVEKVNQAGGWEEYVKENGLQQADEFLMQEMRESFSWIWVADSDADQELQTFLENSMGDYQKLEGEATYYYTPIRYHLDPQGEVLCYQVCWTQGDSFFTGTVPASVWSDFCESNPIHRKTLTLSNSWELAPASNDIDSE